MYPIAAQLSPLTNDPHVAGGDWFIDAVVAYQPLGAANFDASTLDMTGGGNLATMVEPGNPTGFDPDCGWDMTAYQSPLLTIPMEYDWSCAIRFSDFPGALTSQMLFASAVMLPTTSAFTIGFHPDEVTYGYDKDSWPTGTIFPASGVFVYTGTGLWLNGTQITENPDQTPLSALHHSTCIGGAYLPGFGVFIRIRARVQLFALFDRNVEDDVTALTQAMQAQ